MSNPNIRPIERWMSDSITGDVLLHSATTGVFLGHPEDGECLKPPAYFAQDPAYAKGYAFWERRTSPAAISELGDLAVGVLLVDPNHPEGLGDPDEVAMLVGMSDAVAYSVRRGVDARLNDNPRIAKVEGLVVADPDFEHQLDLALRHTEKVINCDVPTTEPVTAAMERAVFEAALRPEQGDYLNPTQTIMAADMVYCNTLQMGEVGLAAAPLYGSERDISKILIIAPAENGALGRKISSFADAPVENLFSSEDIAGDSIHRLYEYALGTGILPREAFSS
jgi:hypothetical protein